MTPAQRLFLGLALLGATASSLAAAFQNLFLVGTILGLVGAVVPVWLAFISSGQPGIPTATPTTAVADSSAGGPTDGVTSAGQAPAEDQAAAQVQRRWSTRSISLAIAVVLVVLINITTVVLNLTLRSGSGAAADSPCGKKLAFIGRIGDTDWHGAADLYNAARIAVDGYNTEHASCAVQLIALDTSSAGDAERTSVLNDQAVLGVIGPAAGDEVMGLSADLSFVGLPYIALSPAYDDNTFDVFADEPGLGAKASGFHRLQSDGASEAAAAARFVKAQYAPQRVFIVSPWSGGWGARKDAFSAEIGLGTIVGSALTNESFGAAIAASHPDVVFYAGVDGYGPGHIADEIASLNPKPLVVAATGPAIYYSERSSSSRLRPEDGTVVVCSCPPTTLAPTFVTAYHDRFHQAADGAELYAFEATRIFLAGLLSHAKSRAQMKAWIDSHSVDGLITRYHFTDTGDLDPAAARFWVYKASAGTYRLLKEA